MQKLYALINSDFIIYKYISYIKKECYKLSIIYASKILFSRSNVKELFENV